jgi:hypothetical protein
MKITVKGMARFCGVDWFYLPQDRPVTGYCEQLHDGSGSTKGEEIFEEFSDCEFLKSDFDQWIQVSRAHPNKKKKKKEPQHRSESTKLIQLYINHYTRANIIPLTVA